MITYGMASSVCKSAMWTPLSWWKSSNLRKPKSDSELISDLWLSEWDMQHKRNHAALDKIRRNSI